MNNSIKVMLISAFTLLLNSYALAYEKADTPMESALLTSPPPHCHEKFIPPHLMRLDLSQEQEDKIFALIYPTIPTMRDHEKKRHAWMEALRKLSNNNTLDETKAKQLTEQLSILEKESLLQRVRIDHQIYSILTDAQRQKLESLPPPHFPPHGLGAKPTASPMHKMSKPHALM